MSLDNAPWRPVETAPVTWRDGDTPFSSTFDDVYFSADDGLAESRHVFLDGNDLPLRWQSGSRDTFCVAETGFGTGLNFLATYAAWRASATPRPRLHYIAVELFPLRSSDLARALAPWPTLEREADELLDLYPAPVPGQHRLHLAGGQVCLDLWWDEAQAVFQSLAATGLHSVDAWYLDGFAPSRNSSLWTPDLFRAMAALSSEQATFSTFTAAGQVRRDLRSAGFLAVKRPGFGSKRESLHGVFEGVEAHADDKVIDKASEQPDRRRTAAPREPMWDVPQRRPVRPDHVLVLGAGLAGATTAASLAARGITVTVLEKHRIASGASANAQGVLYTRLPLKHSDLTDFALQSYLHATALYRSLLHRGVLETPVDGALCGTFLQSKKPDDLAYLAPVLADIPELASVLSPAEAATLLGVTPAMAGVWLPRSGWISPPRLCAALLDNPLIDVRENLGEVTLSQANPGWLARVGDQDIARGPCVVVATGTETLQQPELAWLPLQPVRGQTTLLPASAESRQLKAVLCHHGYVAPSPGDTHCIGATFSPGDDDTTLRGADHTTNLTHLAEAVDTWRPWLESLDPQTLQGQARLRCASNDYLPMVGPVPDRASFIEQYAALRKNARQPIDAPGDYIDGLYVTTGHGSRGLTSTPLAAEHLASAICGELAPLSRKLGRALSPARFIIRDLIRSRC